MLENTIEIPGERLYEEVSKLKAEGFRLVAVSCESVLDKLELIYNFDLNYKMKNLRILVEPSIRIKSISSIYPSGFLIENEFQDLFGIEFEGLTIDYRGRLYLSEKGPTTPMLQKEE